MSWGTTGAISLITPILVSNDTSTGHGIETPVRGLTTVNSNPLWCPQVTIARSFPLAETCAAHDTIEGGFTKGRLILEI